MSAAKLGILRRTNPTFAEVHTDHDRDGVPTSYLRVTRRPVPLWTEQAGHLPQPFSGWHLAVQWWTSRPDAVWGLVGFQLWGGGPNVQQTWMNYCCRASNPVDVLGRVGPTEEWTFHAGVPRLFMFGIDLAEAFKELEAI